MNRMIRKPRIIAHPHDRDVPQFTLLNFSPGLSILPRTPLGTARSGQGRTPLGAAQRTLDGEDCSETLAPGRKDPSPSQSAQHPMSSARVVGAKFDTVFG